MSTEIEPRRFFALDRVRAKAMLLGVAYHTMLFRVFAGGMPRGPMGSPGASQWIQGRLHSFRKPLFFLVSGFFGRTMLEKRRAAWEDARHSGMRHIGKPA